MCLKWFCNKFCKQSKLKPPNYIEDIGYDDIVSVLSAEAPNASRILVDRKYKTSTKVEFESFIKQNTVDLYKYVSEYYDCDDFSFALKGAISNPDWGALTFGIVFAEMPTGAKHALNFFIDNNREFWFVEPQTDRIWKPTTDWKIYFLLM